MALPSSAPEILREVIRALEDVNIPIKTVPDLRNLLRNTATISQIRNVTATDLLTRLPIQFKQEPIQAFVSSKRVLVTGAVGSIGSESCRQIARYQPERLILLDNAEKRLVHH
jgi:FlaA1/EpsC-like NDP-sugar epimerase